MPFKRYVLANMFVLEVMADFQPYRFEPERVPNPGDMRRNEEVNNRLESTFWCTCERCEIMPTQRECLLPRTVRARKQNGRYNVEVLFKLLLHWSQ